MQKYTVNQYFVSNILNWVQEKEIAIPEIQRPFVWSSALTRFPQQDRLKTGLRTGGQSGTGESSSRQPSVAVKD